MFHTHSHLAINFSIINEGHKFSKWSSLSSFITKLLICFSTVRAAYPVYLTLQSKEIPVQVWTGPEGSRRLTLPEFWVILYIKVARLSAVHTGCLHPPKRYPWYSFPLRAKSIRKEEGLSPWKIEPATFRLVSQCVTQLRHRVSHIHQLCALLFTS